MEKTLLNTVIEEKLTSMPTDRELKRHTRWIAFHSLIPIVSGDFGFYINPFCHVHEGYSQQYLLNLNK